MEQRFRIVLADDHVVFMDALTAVLSQLGHVVLAAATSRAALRDSVRAFQPDICLVENHLHDGGGVDLIRQLADASPNTRIVVLTADRDPVKLHRALEEGAVGYVHKSRSIAALLDTLGRVDAGEVVIEGSFSRSPVPNGHRPELLRMANYLTNRELECLALLAEGLDTAMMASRLGVSATTIRSHVQGVLTKLGVHSRLEAAAVASRYHLVETPADAAPAGYDRGVGRTGLRQIDDEIPHSGGKT